MNILVLHDYFEALEGGGKLCSLLAQMLPATLGYGFSRPHHPFLNKVSQYYDLKSYSRIPLWRQYKLAHYFFHKATSIAHYEAVIYSGFYAPLAVRHHRLGKNILYCHTPPRFIYDQRDFYLAQLPWALRPLLQQFITYLQPRYEAAIEQMDVLIANSYHVQQRINQYLHKEAQVMWNNFLGKDKKIIIFLWDDWIH